MEKNNWIFLTEIEALDAIAIDFQQYGPQPRIFRELAPLILTHGYRIVHQGKDTGIWIQHGPDDPLQRVDDKNLGFYFCHLLETAPCPVDILARICAIVFKTRAVSQNSRQPECQGVWIENHMQNFVCCQCGHCCSELGYENECTKQDYDRWQALGRTDIIERVMIIQEKGQEPRYRIWLDKATGKLARTCPWLEPHPQSHTFNCRIQDVKPAVCQQYPFTKKHAEMTGCRGRFCPGDTKKPGRECPGINDILAPAYAKTR